MAGVFVHYRLSSVGVELQKCLEELERAELIDENQMQVINENFDKAMCDALSSQVKVKAVIKGSLHHYRNHDDIWSFYLNNVEVKLDNQVNITSDEKLRIISVSKR